MSKYSQHLTYSLLAALAGLPVGCIAGGLLVSIYGLLNRFGDLEHFLGALVFGLFVAMVAAFIGILPAFLYGAPVYALLSKHGVANLPTSLAVGIFPGLLFLLIKPIMAGFVLLFGVCVAVSTHLFAKRRMARLAGMGANNSFKPKPLRGSA